MQEMRISVVYADGALTIDPPSLEIVDGDWVCWQLIGAPAKAQPVIRFAQGLGPFQSVRSLARTWVLAKGNVGGGPGQPPYSYSFLLFVPGEPEPLCPAASGAIVNAAVQADTSPTARVTYTPPPPDRPEAGGTLTVQPSHLRLFDGDTAIWEAEDLPEGAFLNLLFHQGDAPLLGPFVEISTVRSAGAQRMGIHATGFMERVPLNPSRLTYELELRDAAGRRLAGTDPVIDRLPPPSPDGPS